jgi:probable phosphoglycerate mutase
MQNIYFIRHGESEANQKHICAGHTDVELTALGIQQAKQAGLELQDSGLHIDLLISSPLKRALNTAKEIAKIINYPEDKIVIRKEAIERYRGNFEGKPTSLQHGVSDDQYIAEGAESEAQMKQRATQLLEFAKSRTEDNILIVSHNQFGRSVVAYTTGKERSEIERLPNAHIIKIAPSSAIVTP